MSGGWEGSNTLFAVHLVRMLGHFLWQGTAIAIIVALAMPLMRRLSATTRYWFALAALAAMAACPPLTFVLLTSRGDSSASASPVLVVSPQASSGQHGVAPRLDAAGERGERPLAAFRVSSAPDSAPPPAKGASWQSYAPYGAGAYLLGAALMLLRLLYSLYDGQRLSVHSRPIDDPDLLMAIARQVKRMGLTYTPAIAYCQRVATPCVVGFLRPMLLLPLSVTSGLSVNQVELLLGHELAHIRRYDHLLNLGQRLVEAMLFFHPAVWFVSGKVRDERECCCDDMVVARSTRRSDYAESLLRMAEVCFAEQMGAEVAAMGLSAAGNPSRLRQRIVRLLEQGGVQDRLHLDARSTLVVGLVAVLTLIVPLGLDASTSLRSAHVDDRLASLSVELKRDPAAVNARVQNDWTRLHVAVTSGSYDEVAFLLKQGADPNARTDKGWTPLHFAADLDRVTPLLMLLDAKGEVNAQNVDGITALHVAVGIIGAPIRHGGIRASNLAALQALLERGANPNLQEANGRTPLHTAAERGLVECCQVLLQAGADVNRRDGLGNTPLHLACDLGDAKVVQLLLNYQADAAARDKAGWLPIDHLALHARKHGPLVATYAEARDLLMGHGCQPGLCASVALQLHDRVAELLRQDPASANKRDGQLVRDWTALHWAAHRSDYALCQLLLNAGAQANAVDEDQQTPLFQVVDQSGGHGNESDGAIATLLLSRGADLRARDAKGWTPLMAAARVGQQAVVKLLLERGADPNTRTVDDTTPLAGLSMPWPQSGDTHALRATALLLLAQKADPNLPDKRGRTPLHVAAEYSNPTMVELLLAHQADVNAKDSSGRTPLHAAVCSRRPSVEVVRRLLGAGAKAEAVDEKGLTPLAIARSSANQEIIGLLTGPNAGQSAKTPSVLADK